MDGKPSLPVAWKEKIGNPEFKALLQKVEVKVDPKYEVMFEQRTVHQPPWPAHVQVHMRDGKTFASEVLSPKGDPGNPMTQGDVKDKFMRLAGTTLSESRASEIMKMVDRLESIPEVSDLAARLAAR